MLFNEIYSSYYNAVAAIISGLVAIHSEGQAVALDIDSLARLVVVVETVLSDLDLHSAGLVLDVEALVEVARLVCGRYYSLDYDLLIDGPRLACHIHVRQLCYGVGRLKLHLVVSGRIIIVSGEYGLEFLA